MWEIVFLVACVLALVGELYVWDTERLWHRYEPKRDPRNMKPPF